MARKPIPKQVRFEVLKRDKFTCQYCGRSAPEVVLEIDHIKPVSKGGTNDIMNLVTACKDCNIGKTNRQLSDHSTVQIQKRQLDEMQARREQLEMMLKWRDELENELKIEIGAINALFDANTGYTISNNGELYFRKLIKRFSFNEVYEAAEIAITRYFHGTDESVRETVFKIGGICYNKRKARENDAEQDS